MFSTKIDFELLNVARSKTAIFKDVYDRKFSTLYYKYSGSVDYQVNGTSFFVDSGDILFIPAHSHYTVRSVTDGEYISVHFRCAEMEVLPPRLYSDKLHIDTGELFLNIWRCWVTARDENIFLCHSSIYQLFSQLAAYEKRGYAPQSKYTLIAPSIEYMEKHLFDTELKITDLNTPSGISYVYFERLFKLFLHSSPAKYIIGKRINCAKELFESGDFLSVAQVAEDTGYSDPLYFSRLFKRQTGMSPSEYIRNMRLT